MVCRNLEEGREGGEIRNFTSIWESGGATMNEGIFGRKTENLLREIDDLQESCEIGCCIRGHDARTPVGRIDAGEIFR